ncbi:hypothetical protein DAPPUDRAFT_253506 [Daphnia pulex]|uniref:Uncharacterized protein n=1 Tax=Daphnia pulex TaxID=6669 RepID=E9H504_DAPPU|nr:hypothetical protein DAPPUDRAFT_253506 [Daphnia pulex]|eukprot:EFX73240.1 hypothetical protein DAPPUDRAFT_253506 [Daphnia pulex]
MTIKAMICLYLEEPTSWIKLTLDGKLLIANCFARRRLAGLPNRLSITEGISI